MTSATTLTSARLSPLVSCRDASEEGGLSLAHRTGSAQKPVSAAGMVEISALDTGIRIAVEHHELVLEGFRQVGTADKKAEGQG